MQKKWHKEVDKLTKDREALDQELKDFEDKARIESRQLKDRLKTEQESLMD